MTNEEILWELRQAYERMVARKAEKFGAEHPWRKYHGQDVRDSYELGFIQATAAAIQMLEGFDPEMANTGARRRPILSGTVESP